MYVGQQSQVQSVLREDIKYHSKQKMKNWLIR
jgi:hypothetical protein